MINKLVLYSKQAAACSSNFESLTSMSGGLSNTPPTYSNNLEQNVCIDYLKIRFDGVFSLDSSEEKNWLPLIRALRVNKDVFDTDYFGGFEKVFIFDSNVFIMIGKNQMNNSHGEKCSILELKGQACREFESRGGCWISLFDEVMKLSGKCLRIDVALDDFTGVINENSLLDKTRKQLYSSDYKSSPEIITGNGKSLSGFSITFGRNSSKTLCIYNKISERLAKGYVTQKTDWLRFESRFKRESGDAAFSHVYSSLVDKTFDICAKKLIKGLIDFKKGNKKISDLHNVARLKSWEKWDKLLNVEDRIKIRNQFKLEASLMTKINWLDRSASKNRIFMELFSPDVYNELDGHFVYKHINKIKNRDIANLNYARKAQGLKTLTIEEVRDYLVEKYGKYKNLSIETNVLIGKMNFDGEIIS